MSFLHFFIFCLLSLLKAVVGPQPDTTLSLTCPYPAACSFRLPACNWRICCNLSMSSSFSCTNTQQTDHAAHLLSACNCCVLYRQNMQLSFCMCIAGSMGFGSAGSKQRTDHIHCASPLCIAFPLWPPQVPLRPGSFPRRCRAAVHAQSSSHHSVIPLRLGAQLQTVSHVHSSCSYIQAACCTHFAWQYPSIIMCCMWACTPTCSTGCQACSSK